MSILTLLIMIVLFSVAIIFMKLKRMKINALNKGIQQKEAEVIKSVLEQPLTQKILSSYVLDLYMAAALRIEANYDGLKAHLISMTQCNYSAKEDRQFLTLYFHFFMIRKDYDFASKLLAKIHKNTSVQFIKCCESTYRVLANQEYTLIKEMSNDIEDKLYDGFDLAVITYLIAVQYENLGEIELAMDWYEVALSVFQPKDLYVAQIKEKLLNYEDLSEDE